MWSSQDRATKVVGSGASLTLEPNASHSLSSLVLNGTDATLTLRDEYELDIADIAIEAGTVEVSGGRTMRASAQSTYSG